MKKFPEIDWNKDYPPPKMTPPYVAGPERSATQKKVMKKRMANGEIPFSTLTPEQNELRLQKMRETKKKKTQKRFDYYIPKMKEGLEACDNSRKRAAEHIGIKEGHFRKLIRETKHIVNWTEEYPTPYNRAPK